MSRVMNVATRVRAVLPEFSKGVKGIEIPDIRPECEDEWGKDYAILNNVYVMEEEENEPFKEFDSWSFWREAIDRFVELLKSGPGKAETFVVVGNGCNGPTVVVSARPKKSTRTILYVKPTDILVRLYRGSREIEIYRASFGKES